MQNIKLIARLWFDFINKEDIEGICAITADTWKIHGSVPEFPEADAGIHELFSNLGPVKHRWEVKDLFAEGNKVAVRAINHCKQENLFGVTSRNREQIFTATFIHRIEEGKIQETWRNADDLGRVLRSGAQIVPAMEKLKSA